MMKKLLLIILTILFFNINAFSQTTSSKKALDIVNKAQERSNLLDSIKYIKNSLDSVQEKSEKRALLIILANLQEEVSLFEDAKQSYVKAAAISASSVSKLSKKTNEELVLDAVRCSLSCGDCDSADKYLNSSVRSSKNAEILAYVKLYEQWSSLCKAKTTDDLTEPLEVLKAYLKVSSMKQVHSVILLTLWYITGKDEYSAMLTKNYPSSTEASIVKGDIQLLPVPFWYFVPKSGEASIGTGSLSENVKITVQDDSTEQNVQHKFSKWQLGLFKTEKNAQSLCDELKTKGFNATITSEKRASGTVYYIVTVNENSNNNISEQLRSAGYDCYPVD